MALFKCFYQGLRLQDNLDVFKEVLSAGKHWKTQALALPQTGSDSPPGFLSLQLLSHMLLGEIQRKHTNRFPRSY